MLLELFIGEPFAYMYTKFSFPSKALGVHPPSILICRNYNPMAGHPRQDLMLVLVIQAYLSRLAPCLEPFSQEAQVDFDVMLRLHAAGVFCFCTTEISGLEMDLEGPYQGLHKQQTRYLITKLVNTHFIASGGRICSVRGNHGKKWRVGRARIVGNISSQETARAWTLSQ